jgi:nucleoside-diphosphate-sugar epimerase
MQLVVVTGASLPLGRRVTELLSALDANVVVRDFSDVDSGAGTVDVVIHLVPGDHDALVARAKSAAVDTPGVLEFATVHSTSHVVVLSSALVYGAWPNNPVPLTEDATLRPDFGFAYARQLATVEQMADDWRNRRPGRAVTVLRPVPAMAADGTSGLVRALAAGMGGRMGEDDVPAQFVHLDDLADPQRLGAHSELQHAEQSVIDQGEIGKEKGQSDDQPYGESRRHAKRLNQRSMAEMAWAQSAIRPPGTRPSTSTRAPLTDNTARTSSGAVIGAVCVGASKYMTLITRR